VLEPIQKTIMKNKPTYKELEKQIEILKLKSAKQKVDKAFHAGELVIANKEKVKRAKERTLELQKQNKISDYHFRCKYSSEIEFY